MVITIAIFFLFRSYAEFTLNGLVVVVSFDVQTANEKIHVWGDIAEEDGFMLKNIIDEFVDEDNLITLTKVFASRCVSNADLVVSGLRAIG